MKKQILSVLLTIVMVLGLLPTTAFAGGGGLFASPNALEFGSVEQGYTTIPEAKTVTLTTTGSEFSLTQPTSSNYEIGTLSSTTVASEKQATFTVQPKSGLTAGNYDETLTISGGGYSTSVSLKFTVNGGGTTAAQAKIGETSYETLEEALTAASGNTKADMIEIISEDVTAVDEATLKAGDSIKTYPDENDTKDINKATTDVTLKVDDDGTVMFTSGEIEVVEGAALLGGGGSATGKSGVSCT